LKDEEKWKRKEGTDYPGEEWDEGETMGRVLLNRPLLLLTY